MSTEPGKIAVVTAPPIDTLKELRRQNSALLQRDVAGAGTSKPTTGELLGFLEAASKLGRSLDDLDARETAQGIMDVWIASVLSRDPSAANGTRPFTLEDYDESSAGQIANDAQQLRVEAVAAAQRADDILPAAPPQLDGLKKRTLTRIVECIPTWMQPIAFCVTGCDADADAEIAQRLLLRFIRLKEKSLDAYAVPLAGDDDILREPKAKELLQKLIKAGVVKQQESTGNAPATYVLAHDSLLTKWSLLSEFITQRKAFRELARGWENGGRQHGALLIAGPQLDQAIDYPHLDSLETTFLDFSRRAGDSHRRFAFSVAATALVVLTLLVCWLIRTNVDLRIQDAKVAQDLATTKTLGSVFKSLRDLVDRRTPYALDLAKSITKAASAACEKPMLPAPGRHNMEVFVGLDSDFISVDGLVEFLKLNGYDMPVGTPLPRNLKASPTVVRAFYISDRLQAGKLADLLAPTLAGIMPIEEVTTRLGAQAAGKSDEEKRALLMQPANRKLLIELDLPADSDHEDKSAPKDFFQVMIEPKALPRITP